MICATSKDSDQPAHTRSLIRAFARRLNASMRVMLLTEHHLEFISLKGGFTGSSESTLVKITHCWKLHVAAQIKILIVSNRNIRLRVPAPLKQLAGLFYFISLCSEQRQFTETLLSLFIRCSVPGVVLIVSIPDICLLLYFLYSHKYLLTRNTVYCTILTDQIVVGCPLGLPISY